MQSAARSNRMWCWMMGAMFALLMPFTVMGQAAPPAAQPAVDTAVAAEEAECRACTYERIGRKVDIGLVALMATLIIGVLFAVSREWGTSSQRWTCRSTALFLAAMGLVFVRRAGSVLYLGYSPWQEAQRAAATLAYRLRQRRAMPGVSTLALTQSASAPLHTRRGLRPASSARHPCPRRCSPA